MGYTWDMPEVIDLLTTYDSWDVPKSMNSHFYVHQAKISRDIWLVVYLPL